MKKVSIIVPAYNIEKYIKKCIESLINQTYKNIEILIINDGSTDKTKEIALSFEKKDKRVKVLTKKNGGLSDARNYGLSRASGAYILFIDGDDYIKNDTIEKLINKIDDNDIISFNYITLNNNKETLVPSKNKSKDNTINYILGQPSACTKMYKRTFLIENKIQFDKNILYEDLAIIPSLACLTRKIKIIDDYYYYYVIRNSSIIHNKLFSPKKDDKFIAISNLIDRFKKYGKFDEYKNELEYITVKNLIVVYGTELLEFSSSIYKNRFDNVINFLDVNFPNYKENRYLKNDSFKSKLFIFLFTKRQYKILKLIYQLTK